MLRSFLSGIGFWLGLMEGLAGQGELRGLTWGAGRLGPLVSVGALAMARPGPLALAASLPVAAALQVGLASLIRPQLNPRLRLQPGQYLDRTIEQVAIEGAYGPVPALHITPKTGARSVVCVAHGSGCDKTFYTWRLTDECIGQGLAVLLIDLDGHGESPRPQAYPAILESVAGPERWLRERYARVALLGMSLGGAVTARAVAEGTPCDALVLWEVAPQLRLNADEYRQVQRNEALRILRPTLLHLFRDGTIYHIVRAWQTSGIRAEIGTWDLFDHLDLMESLGRLKAQATRPQLLLIYAERDAVVSAEAAEAVRTSTEGWGEFHLIRGASHVSLPSEPATIGTTVTWLAAKLRLA
ncbi:alpha/beta hydrolase [Candidatus Chloroploca mongolica]|nr:alpha/beta fold hydrolase [Candidatus Chloroploca mongolica]